MIFGKVILLATTLLTLQAQAKVRVETVEYKDGDVTLEGLVAYDSKRAAKRPGVLVVHEWVGINPYIKSRLEQLAALGYTAFAADIYGKGVRPNNPKDAAATAEIYKSNRQLMRQRVNLGLEQLRKHKTVDSKKVAATGYCFGGTSVLELARSGSDVLGVVSFHGSLNTPKKEDAKNIKARVLVLHGADDPYVPYDEVKNFEDEMRAANVKWRLVKYSQAVHSFTNPEVGNDPSKGQAYNAEADKQSWKDMRDFLNELFTGK